MNCTQYHIFSTPIFSISGLDELGRAVDELVTVINEQEIACEQEDDVDGREFNEKPTPKV